MVCCDENSEGKKNESLTALLRSCVHVSMCVQTWKGVIWIFKLGGLLLVELVKKKCEQTDRFLAWKVVKKQAMS